MRLIDADAMEARFVCGVGADEFDWVYDAHDLPAMLSEMPTVDAVPVVRCNDCKHRYYYDEENIAPVCTAAMRYAATPDDWYCADGKRKGGDE